MSHSTLPELENPGEFIARHIGVSDADEAQLLLLDDDLNELGPVLEERFKQEDRLVKALHVVESLSTQQA